MSIDKVAAAIRAPEAGVAEPKRSRLSSFAAQVLDLDVGQQASRVMQVPTSSTLEEIAGDLPDYRDNLRNGCAPAIKRAKEKLVGAEYTTEIGVVTMPAMTMYVVAVVTRVS